MPHQILDLVQKAVEAGSELPDLVPVAELETPAQVAIALGDLLHRRGHPGQGAADGATGQPGEQDAQQQAASHQSGDDERGVVGVFLQGGTHLPDHLVLPLAEGGDPLIDARHQWGRLAAQQPGIAAPAIAAMDHLELLQIAAIDGQAFTELLEGIGLIQGQFILVAGDAPNQLAYLLQVGIDVGQ